MFQGTSFSHVAATKDDDNQLLLSPVSVVQTAEIPAKSQKQGEFLAHKGLTLAAFKYTNTTRTETLTSSGLPSLQTHALLLACQAPVGF